MGSKNAYKVVATAEAAAEATPEDRRIPDITAMIAEHLRLIRSAQESLSRGGAIRDIVDLSRALEAAVKAVERAARTQDEIFSRLSDAAQIETSIRRLEAADPSAISLAIRRLRERLDQPTVGGRSAVDALRDL